jgi:putative ABC transport system ATP-binding protein
MVGLAGREDHYPNQLSGGQQQRVAIARSMINDPAIILADEPTGNLDSRTSEDVMAVFQTLNRAGKTVVLITHEPDIAQFARRVVVFKDGKVLSDEPVEQKAAESAESVVAGRAG